MTPIKHGAIISILLVTQLTSAMFNLDPAALFRHYCKSENSGEQLGYDPHIQFIDTEKSDHHTVSHPTIYLHGLGDNSECFLRNLTFITKKYISPYLLTMPAIFFDFADAGLYKKTALSTKIAALGQSNMGQLKDIVSFAYILNLCHKAGFKAVDLYGFSRGATTIVTTLAALVESKHSQELGALGINQQTGAEIVAMIKRGCITLDCPLKQVNQTLINNYGIILGPFISHVIAPLFTHYNPWGEQALEAMDSLAERNFKILLHYEQNDPVVTNWGDRLFYEKARAISKKHIYLMTSHDGGHNTMRRRLPTIFHAFKKQHGYTDYPLSTELAAIILANHQPDPKTIKEN